MKLEDYKYLIDNNLDLLSLPISKEEQKAFKKTPLNKIYASYPHLKNEEVLKLYLRLPNLNKETNMKSYKLLEGVDGWVYFGLTGPNKQLQGQGMMIFLDGSLFEGSFAQNSILGKGRLISPKLNVIVANWQSMNIVSDAIIFNSKEQKLYFGETKDMVPHGNGIEHSHGQVYTGNFKAGVKDGKAEIVWAHGNYYIGSFSNNKLDGYGEYYWKNGTSYKGHWKYNKFHGKGTYQWNNGEVYEGNYKKGLKEGYGILKQANGLEFRGYWSKGRQDGLGTEFSGETIVRKGTWVKGEFKRHVDDNGIVSAGIVLTPLLCKAVSRSVKTEKSTNILSGLILQSSSNIDSFRQPYRRQSNGSEFFLHSLERSNSLLSQLDKTEFLLDLNDLSQFEMYKNSLETHKKYPSFVFTQDFDERKYFVEFLQLSEERWFKGEVNDAYVLSGNGVMTDNGNIYIGRWNNGLMEDIGRFISAKGNFFEGFWHNNKKQGFGIEIRQSATYIGDWVNGFRHGSGTLNSKNGWYRGQWTHGTQNGTGRLNYPDGSFYTGSFENGTIHGEGRLTLYDGKVIKGRWEHGNLV